MTFSRSARIDNRGTIGELINHLLATVLAKLFKILISCDNVFWTKFKSTCQYIILHFDYSESIKFTPKHEVQSLLFSDRQQTLDLLCFKGSIDGNRKTTFFII